MLKSWNLTKSKDPVPCITCCQQEERRQKIYCTLVDEKFINCLGPHPLGLQHDEDCKPVSKDSSLKDYIYRLAISVPLFCSFKGKVSKCIRIKFQSATATQGQELMWYNQPCTVICKGIPTPSGSGAAWDAAPKDPMDLYCTKHTERQQQWHLKQHGKQ